MEVGEGRERINGDGKNKIKKIFIRSTSIVLTVKSKFTYYNQDEQNFRVITVCYYNYFLEAVF